MDRREFSGLVAAGVVFPGTLAQAFIQPATGLTGLEGLADDDCPQYILPRLCCNYKDEWPWKGMGQHQKWISRSLWKEVTFPICSMDMKIFTQTTWYRWPKEHSRNIWLSDSESYRTKEYTYVPPFKIDDTDTDFLTQNNPSCYPPIRFLIRDCAQFQKYCYVFEIDNGEYGICCSNSPLIPLNIGELSHV